MGIAQNRRWASRASASAATGARCCSTAPASCWPRRATRGWSCATSPSAASAPRGSIYHHFPGGKAQLAREAAELEGATIRDLIERSLEERGLKETLTMFGEIFRRRVADHPERLGCPVAAAALARPEDPELAAVATAAFQSWERPIAAALRDEGVAPAEAEAFAGLVVSTVEGALLRARAAGDHAPLDSAVAGLGQALDGLLAGTAYV